MEIQFPVYRLIGGQVVCQSCPGGRWNSVDEVLVDIMFEAFDGVALRRGMTLKVQESELEATVNRTLTHAL